jgi:hypothetical protein
MPPISIVTKITNVQNPPPLLNKLPLGYPVHLIRAWQHPFSPYAIGVWVHYFSHQVLLGYIPPPLAGEVIALLDGNQIVSTYLLQYMRVSTNHPTVMVKIVVRP